MKRCRAATVRDAIGLHATHFSLNFLQRYPWVPLGGESGGLVLVAKTFQDKIQDARRCETLIDVLKLVLLLEHLGKVFVRVLIWHHDRTVQFAH